MIGYNKNYVILDFNYMLKNLKGKILVSKINRKDKNNNIRIKYIKFLKELS